MVWLTKYLYLGQLLENRQESILTPQIFPNDKVESCNRLLQKNPVSRQRHDRVAALNEIKIAFCQSSFILKNPRPARN